MSDAETSHLELGLESHIPTYGSAEGRGGGRVHGFLLITFLNLPMQRNPSSHRILYNRYIQVVVTTYFWSFIKAKFNDTLI